MTVSRANAREVRRRASGCCEYCRQLETKRSIRFQIDHIIARRHGGDDSLDNLCLSCYECNSYKGPHIAALDPLTEEPTRLYNPRTQNWEAHFDLQLDMSIGGISPEGRATASVLRLNLPRRIIERHEAWLPFNNPSSQPRAGPA